MMARVRRAASAAFAAFLGVASTPVSPPELSPGPTSASSPTGGARPQRRSRRTSPLPVSVTRWHQRDVETAQRAADSGDLTRAGQLRRALNRDGTLHGLVGTRAKGLVRLPKRFKGDAPAVTFLEGAQGQPGAFQAIFPTSELALMDADGFILGVAIGEFVDVPGYPYPVLVRLDPEFLTYRPWEDRWYYRSLSGLLPITPGDGRWVLHRPGGRQEPWNQGLWPALARAFISKEHAFFLRENWNGKLANPARVAVSPQGAGEEQKQAWWRKVMAWGINTVFGTTPGYDVKLLESNGRGYESFKETISDSNAEFMIAVAGQVVTVTGGAGFANADIHATIRADIIQDDGEALATTLNEQAIPAVIAEFVGRGYVASVAWDTRPPANLKAEAESISAGAKAITDARDALAAEGLKSDTRALSSRFAMPLVDDFNGDGRPDNDTPQLSGPPPDMRLPMGPDSAASELADKMTEYKVERCQHGSSNRCWLCGVERTRDFDVGDGGVVQWHVKWRPIPTTGSEAA